MTDERQRVRWGLISTARINDWLLDAGRRTRDTEFLAVASRAEDRARSYASARGIPRAYGSYEALLADPEIDAVYISVPNSMHLEWAREALIAGKHVLCEKPMDRDASRVRAAFDHAADAGLILTEGFMYRYHPQTQALLGLVKDGTIGALSHVRACMSFSLDDPASDPRNQQELDGGALMDAGCYCVSAVCLLADQLPQRVYARVISTNYEVDSRCFAMLEFPGGVTGQIDCGMDLPRRDGLEVVGSEATLVLDDPWHCRAPAFELRRGRGHDDQSRESIDVDNSGTASLAGDLLDTYRLQLEAFNAAVRGERARLVPAEESVRQAVVIDALYRSAHRAQPIEL